MVRLYQIESSESVMMMMMMMMVMMMMMMTSCSMWVNGHMNHHTLAKSYEWSLLETKKICICIWHHSSTLIQHRLLTFSPKQDKKVLIFRFWDESDNFKFFQAGSWEKGLVRPRSPRSCPPARKPLHDGHWFSYTGCWQSLLVIYLTFMLGMLLLF